MIDPIKLGDYSVRKLNCLMTEGELHKLYKLADETVKKGDLVIEIGTWKGGSAYVLGNVCKTKGARLICIEEFSGDGIHSNPKLNPELLKEVMNNLKDLPVSFLPISSVVVNNNNYIEDESVSLIYIDGDHYIPVVENDIQFAIKKTIKGGVICGHDYGPSVVDVKKVVDKYFSKVNVPNVGSETLWWVKKE